MMNPTAKCLCPEYSVFAFYTTVEENLNAFSFRTRTGLTIPSNLAASFDRSPALTAPFSDFFQDGIFKIAVGARLPADTLIL
jgi:hypothetical protein